ncbi:Uncharacterised protein [Pasteurella multocida]|nr:Uncharacterised protein [Pasteurella multocida]
MHAKFNLEIDESDKNKLSDYIKKRSMYLRTE